MSNAADTPHVAVIGAGFCGLAAGYELARRGVRVTVLERDAEIGGLAGSFTVNGAQLEKFYHHWFTSDRHILELVEELGTGDRVVHRYTRTGMYYANEFFRLSSPLDVLRFTPLSPIDRLRLGWLALRARHVTHWRRLERLTAAEWLRKMGGTRVYEVVWEPLLRGKFGEYAGEVGAVWFWNKLALRGSSRGRRGAEQLAYYRGGFAALANQLAGAIRALGGTVQTNTPVEALAVSGRRVIGVTVSDRVVEADAVIATPALPVIANLMAAHTSAEYTAALRRIKYLANVCLVLQLDRSLSDTYWLNVNDPAFPFVGIIQHTNFEPPASYGGRHIVYLSKYIPESAELFTMADASLLEYTLPHLQRMFPEFRREWIKAYHVWRARFAQPVVERHYGSLIPSHDTPLANMYIATMAQIYPEDRGTNYAIREGRKIGAHVAAILRG